MDLSVSSLENIEYMIEEIKKKLRMATGAALKATNFDEGKYEDLKDIYDMISSKASFSISEIEALTKELGQLRKVE